MAVEPSTLQSLRVRLLLPLSLVLVVIAIGTLGYRWLWHDVGGTWMDALFMTVTTITTIGYGEISRSPPPAACSRSGSPSPASAACSTCWASSWNTWSASGWPIQWGGVEWSVGSGSSPGT